MERITDKNIFLQDSTTLAKFLLGKMLVRTLDDGTKITKRITEVEIYKQNDSACHAHKGKTKRNAPLFEKGGTIYVYLCYGLFNLLNIVGGQKDDAQGILIRGVDEHFGSGRVAKILKITKELNTQSIISSDELSLWDDGLIVRQKDIEKLKRVGIDYAKPIDRNRLWRFRLYIPNIKINHR